MAYFNDTASIWWTSSALVFALSFGMASGCGDEPPNDGRCDDPRPSFDLTLRAETGTLPRDTVVTVTYGGGEEQYSLRHPNRPGQVVFCSAEFVDDSGAAGAGAEGAGAAAGTSATAAGGAAPAQPRVVESVRCELWTDGAATVRVETDAYPLLEEELSAEADDRCGAVTVEVDLELRQDLDAGTD